MIESKNLRFKLFPDPVGHFGLSGRLGVAGSAALQALSECPMATQSRQNRFLDQSTPSMRKVDDGEKTPTAGPPHACAKK